MVWYGKRLNGVRKFSRNVHDFNVIERRKSKTFVSIYFLFSLFDEAKHV